MQKGIGLSFKIISKVLQDVGKVGNVSFSSCMFDEYPNLSPNIGGAEITLPGCKTMYRYGVAIPSTLLAQQSKVKTNFLAK